jgi:Tryptophan-rich Synechocystis species C-terminal domain
MTITIRNTFGPQNISDVQTANPFNAVGVTDTATGLTETLTVALSNAANGTLSNLDGGTYNAATGLYTVTGSITAVQSALDGLIFTPTYQTYVANATVSTTLTVTVTNAAGGSGTDSTTKVVATDSSSPKPIAPIEGIDYGPTPGTGVTYPSNSQIDADMARIAKIANAVHLYTVSNGMGYAVTSAIAHGLRVIPTAYLVDPNSPGGTAANDAEVANLFSVINSLPTSELAMVPFVDVGGDFLTNNPTQLSYLQTEIAAVRAGIPASVQITSTQSISTYLANAGLASSVDLLFPTINPFAMGNASTSGAVAYSLLEYQALLQAYPNQNVILSGVGWPSAGTNGGAVGSVANEEAFWTQFIQTASQNKINYFGFQAFDSASNANTDFTGSNWGLYTASGVAKGSVTTFIPQAINGAVGGQQTLGGTAMSPFTGVSITDAGSGQTETVTITLSSPTAGSFGNLGGGTYNAATGVYTVAGTTAAVTSAVRAVTFSSSVLFVSQQDTTTFTIVATDNAGASITDITTTVTPIATAVEQFGSTYLAVANNKYYLWNHAGIGANLQSGGAPVTVGQIGAWNPIGAEADANGYEVAWYNAPLQDYILWQTDTNGNFTSILTGLLSPTDPSLELLESSFQQDLNGDGTIGIPTNQITQVIETNKLWLVGNEYVLIGSGGPAAILKYQGLAITAGQFGAVNPIAAVQTQTGFMVAWKVTGVSTYIVWNTDTNGNYVSSATGVVTGPDPSFEALETTFGVDLNGDNVIGVTPTQVIETNKLWLVGNEYVLIGSGGPGPILKYQGLAITAGQFGAVNPIAAVQTQTGFMVAWKVTGVSTYIVWNTDTNGNYVFSATGVVTGTDPSLEALETTFGADLNGDNVIGVTPTQVIETNKLWLVGNEYVLIGSGGPGPILKYQGLAITAGQFGAVNPFAAVQTQTGFMVAWKVTGASTYIVWNTDTNGNYVSSATAVVSGTDPSLETLEATFGTDLNGDGTIGIPSTQITQVIETNQLWLVGNEYVLIGSGGPGPTLKYQGLTITAGQFGASTRSPPYRPKPASWSPGKSPASAATSSGIPIPAATTSPAPPALSREPTPRSKRWKRPSAPTSTAMPPSASPPPRLSNPASSGRSATNTS